jgi:uncharacterized protein
MNEIFGREDEIKILNKILNSNSSEFLAVYGRRRVGKTFLIDKFFKNKGKYFHFTGAKQATLKEHLKLFKKAFEFYFCVDKKITTPKSWLDSFFLLRELIEKKLENKNEKIILFFDEIPWIATPKSNFLTMLEHFWNDYFSKIPNGILIVCGSAASWMIEKIIYNKGGLYNRLTAKIQLNSFTLKQTEEYFKANNINLNKKQIVDIYLVTGGVAKYLTYIEKGLSSNQNIQNLCFKKNSPLIDEYNHLFKSLFENYKNHIAIIEYLAKKRSGFTHSELSKILKKPSGGTLSKIINELKEAGFIDYLQSINKKKKEGKYILTDEYCFFYLTWIKDFVTSNFQPISNNYWIEMQGSAKYASWAGFAFESLCRKHLLQIVKALNLQIVAINAIHFTYKKKNNEDKGIQIDLIIDRKDNCMNLFEIKFYNHEFSLSNEEAKKVMFRREKFRGIIKTKKTLFNTLISTYGAKENTNYLEAFDNQITVNDLFV